MAIPEIGKIKIITDWFNYRIGNGETYTQGGFAPASSGTQYFMFDHRVGTQMIGNVSMNGNTGNIRPYMGTTFTGAMALIYSNLYSAQGKVSFFDGTTERTASPVLNASQSGIYCSTSANGLMVIENNSNAVSGLSFQPNSVWGTLLAIDYIHLGKVYELPTNATASLSFNTNSFNKIQRSLGGQTYSTLYNNNRQRIIKASWEFVNWTGGTSGVSDFIEMNETMSNSHYVVALQLSQTGTISSDYFMFARIVDWKQTQMSPTLWKISATFEEFS